MNPSASRRALWLEYRTVAWNVVEGLVAVAAASIALLGFGVESFVECATRYVRCCVTDPQSLRAPVRA